MIQIGTYGKATKLLLTNKRNRIVCCLYILANGNLHPDSWWDHKGKATSTNRGRGIFPYQAFNSFREIMGFIKDHPEAKKEPLLAFRGCRMNLKS